MCLVLPVLCRSAMDWARLLIRCADQVRPNVLELQLQGSSKLDPHYLESYRTALQAAMLLQFSQRGTPHGRAGILSLGQQPALRAVLAAEG